MWNDFTWNYLFLLVILFFVDESNKNLICFDIWEAICERSDFQLLSNLVDVSADARAAARMIFVRKVHKGVLFCDKTMCSTHANGQYQSSSFNFFLKLLRKFGNLIPEVIINVENDLTSHQLQKIVHHINEFGTKIPKLMIYDGFSYPNFKMELNGTNIELISDNEYSNLFRIVRPREIEEMVLDISFDIPPEGFLENLVKLKSFTIFWRRGQNLSNITSKISNLKSFQINIDEERLDYDHFEMFNDFVYSAQNHSKLSKISFNFNSEHFKKFQKYLVPFNTKKWQKEGPNSYDYSIIFNRNNAGSFEVKIEISSNLKRKNKIWTFFWQQIKL